MKARPSGRGRRTLKFVIAYDGTGYAGWQVQKTRVRSGLKPTIQGTLEAVLRRILREPVKLIGSGRTDAGVHALAQVAHAVVRAAMPCERLCRSLNQLLPSDIAVTHLSDAPERFHARFRAVSKRYRYRMFTAAVVPPFVRPYVHHVRVPLNVTLMRREARALKGRHDFRAFVRASSRRGSTVRTITDVGIRRHGPELHLELAATGFLHTMVRSLAGTLLDIGRGRLPPGTLRRMLRSGNRQLAGTTAPACGLTLVSVRYRGRDV